MVEMLWVLAILSGLIVIAYQSGNGSRIVGELIHVATGRELLSSGGQLLIGLLDGSQQTGEKVRVESNGHYGVTILMVVRSKESTTEATCAAAV